MAFKASWRPLTLMLLVAVAAGLINVLVFLMVTNPLMEESKGDEVGVSAYASTFFIGWVFFSAWFLARADEELKKVEAAVRQGDQATFLREAQKRMALSIRLLYLIISALTILSFHFFHLGSLLISSEILFGVGFLVSITVLFLWDLDAPVGGAIAAPDIPAEWVQALRAQEQAAKRGTARQQTP